MHVRGRFFWGYHHSPYGLLHKSTEKCAIRNCLFFWVEELEQEMESWEGTQPLSLALCFPASNSPAERASPGWELLCQLNQSCVPWSLWSEGQSKSRGCWHCIRHTFCKVEWQRVDFACLSLLQQHFPQATSPAKPSGKMVLLGECKLCFTWFSAAPFLGNYYKQ